MIDDDSLMESLEEARLFLERRLRGFRPEVGLVLGSGLGPFADSVEGPIAIPFEEVPHMGTSSAAGHVGQFVAGRVGGRHVLVMQGRLHGYEGFSAQEVAFPIWLMGALGAHTLITTNAAGAINCGYNVGDFCVMRDHINLTGRNPLCGKTPDKMAPRFLSMLDAYDPVLRARLLSIAASLKIIVREGIYLGLFGAGFETPAEIRMFRALGADTVAMSVCEEVIAARHSGMRVVGLSLVSNMACGIEGANPSDDEVHEVAASRLEDFARLITCFLEDGVLDESGHPEKV